MRARLSWGVLFFAGAAACSDEALNRVEISRVEVQPSSGAQDAFGAVADQPLTLDIFVDPPFSLDFDPAFGDEPAVDVRGAPTRGALVRPTGEATAFERVALRAPNHVRADAQGLPEGDYTIVLDGGRDGRLEYGEVLQVRNREPTGEELFVRGLPDQLLADECQTIEIGFVAAGDTRFLAPPRRDGESEILVELEPVPHDGATGRGLAITPPTVCGAEGVSQPAARISSEKRVARWNVRGRTPGLAGLRVTASWLESGDFVDSVEPEENRVRVRGRVGIVPEARLWLPQNLCMGVRWLRRNPRLDDAASPALDLGLSLVNGRGETVDATLYGDANCTEVLESAGLEAGRDFASTFIRVPELGAYTLEGQVLEPARPANWIVEPGAFRVVNEIPSGEVEVRAPSVVAFGIATPMIVESPSPTRCELTLETTIGVPLLDAPVPVEVEDREVVWVVPRTSDMGADEVQAVARCVEPDLRPRGTGVAVSTCSGVALDTFSLRLEVGNLAPTSVDPDVDVSLVVGSGNVPSSVFYAFGDLGEPERARLDATGDLASFRWQAPLTDRIEPITAVVRDAFGCPVVLEQIVYSGADPSRVVGVRPGSLEAQLEEAGVDRSDSSPLVLVFDSETMLNTVFADGSALGATEAELVLLGPGSPALLSLTGEWLLRQSSTWSWIDLHGTGKVSAESGTLWFRDSVLREAAGLDAFGADVTIGPGAYVRGTRRPAVAFGSGLVRDTLVAGGAGATEAPLFAVGSKVRVVQTAVAGSRGPLVGAAFDDEAVTIDIDFSTLHEAAPLDFDALPRGSSASIVGTIFSRVPDWFLPQLESADLTAEASALVGLDSEPSVCADGFFECKVDDLFLDETRPEWLSYVWCDDVDPRLSEWDKTGFANVGDDATSRRYFGWGYDVGHLEHPVSTPGTCR